MPEVTLEIPKWLMDNFSKIKEWAIPILVISIFMISLFLFGHLISILLFVTFSIGRIASVVVVSIFITIIWMDIFHGIGILEWNIEVKESDIK